VTAKQYPIFKFDTILDLTLTEVNLKCATTGSETALIYGDLNTIQTQCRYHISYGTLPPQIFRLSDDLFLFSNVSELQMNCTNSPKHITSAVNKITATQIQFLLTINCGCTARTQGLELPTGSVHCSEDIKIDMSIKHLINLPYLAHFLNVDDFEVLSADVILNDSIPISVSQLPLASLEYKKLQTDEE